MCMHCSYNTDNTDSKVDGYRRRLWVVAGLTDVVTIICCLHIFDGQNTY